MKESKLVQVLSGRFNVSERVLEQLASPEFAKKLFENRASVDRCALAYDLLLIIYEKSIVAGVGLCDAEKAIVREVRSWPAERTEKGLARVAYTFLESDLRTETKCVAT